MTVLLCPGQGSQTPGFLAEWIVDAEALAKLERYSEITGLDLVKHGTESDAETIRDTAVAQPLIVAAGLLAFQALKSKLGEQLNISGVSGHSVGELTAAAVAGIISDESAMKLVSVRSKAMAAAAALEATGMSAVVGGEAETVLAGLKELELSGANYNMAGQIVAAGSLEALAKLKENPPAGSRVIPLQVAGAFHTEYMRSAIPALAEASKTVEISDPKISIWTNFNGKKISSGQEFIDLLVNQVASPVRWDLVQENIAADNPDNLIELTPAGTLVGLAKRALPGIPALAIKTPADLEKAKELVGTI